jgi:polyisoprenoid-binding protein YceI
VIGVTVAAEYLTPYGVEVVKISTTHRRKARIMTNAISETSTHLSDLSGDYTVDASHSRLGFNARHAMVTKVRGQFHEFEGKAHIDTATPANSSVELTIAVDSVSTGSPDRDGHLRSGDFFDTEQYPTWTFRSTDVSRDGEDWTITGDLTIKDVTRPVTIEFEETGSAVDPFGNVRAGFEGSTTINRKDWGLTWNAALETGGVLVSEKIKLEFDVSAIRNA